MSAESCLVISEILGNCSCLSRGQTDTSEALFVIIRMTLFCHLSRVLWVVAPHDPLTEQHYLKWGSTNLKYSIFNKLSDNTFFAYFIFPISLETFEEIRLIWSFHFIWLSKITPRYFTDVFCSIAPPDILKRACISSPLLPSCSFLLHSFFYKNKVYKNIEAQNC